MQGSPQPRGSCSVRAGAPHGLCPVPGTSPMPQAAPLSWHSSRDTDCEPVPTSHLHPLPAGTGGWGCSPSAPQVPQGWAQPAPTQALLPGAAEPRWQPGAEDRGQQRTLGRVLSPWNCIPPPPHGRGTRIQGAAPPFREHDAILGSSTPSRRAAPQSREQQPNPGEQNPSAGSRTPSRGAASQHGEQQPHPRQQNPNVGSATPSRRAAPPHPRGRRPQGAPPVPATPPQQDSRAAAEGCAGRCCARERALCTLGRPTPS